MISRLLVLTGFSRIWLAIGFWVSLRDWLHCRNLGFYELSELFIATSFQRFPDFMIKAVDDPIFERDVAQFLE
jgi:hypothetical protein